VRIFSSLRRGKSEWDTEGQPEVVLSGKIRDRRKPELGSRQPPQGGGRQWRQTVTGNRDRRKLGNGSVSRRKAECGPRGGHDLATGRGSATDHAGRWRSRAQELRLRSRRLRSAGDAGRYRCELRFTSNAPQVATQAGLLEPRSKDRKDWLLEPRSKDRKDRPENTPRGLRLPWGFSRSGTDRSPRRPYGSRITDCGPSSYRSVRLWSGVDSPESVVPSAP